MIASEAEARSYSATLTNARGLERLDHLVELLRDENQRQNLVAPATLEEVWVRHIADSLQLLEHVPRETQIWIDLGTGGGFPGLALAAADPSRAFILVESRKLRVAWLERAVSALGLSNIEVFDARLEAMPTFSADVISARAFAPLDRLLSLAGRFSTDETIWLLPKGRNALKELSGQPEAVRSLFHVEQSRTDASAGILVGRGSLQ